MEEFWGKKTPNPNIKDKLKMGNQMVKEHTLTLMEKSMFPFWMTNHRRRKKKEGEDD